MELIRPEPHRTSTHVRQFRVLIEDLSLLLPLGKCLSMPTLHSAPERSLLVHDCTFAYMRWKSAADSGRAIIVADPRTGES